MSRHGCYRLELQGSCLSTELWSMPPKFLITAAKSLLPTEGKISPVSEDGHIGIFEGAIIQPMTELPNLLKTGLLWT